MDYIASPNTRLVSQGDVCVVYISEAQRYIFKLEPGAQLQTKFGLIKSADLLNHPYGVRFECKRGWVLPLRLTPELWTQLLPHRTQILYQADISMILLQLDIKPNSIVVECGTGSGSLSHNIIRACRPNGFLYTFDVNEFRVQEARSEFNSHGYGKHVCVSHRNVCEQGFGDELEGKADACMLDLPQTWDAIEHAYKILKPDGSKLCTFSPCIEQVQQNVSKMVQLKLKDIVTLETLRCPLEVKVQNLNVWSKETLESLTAIEKKRFDNLRDNLRTHKRMKTSDCSGQANDIEGTMEDSADEEDAANLDEDGKNNASETKLERALSNPKAPFNPRMLPKRSYLYARQYSESASHSGYLTFATRRH